MQHTTLPRESNLANFSINLYKINAVKLFFSIFENFSKAINFLANDSDLIYDSHLVTFFSIRKCN